MTPLKATILENDRDLFIYQQKVKKILNIEFPIAYLKQGKVRAFLNEEGEIVAGYAMIIQAPFRTLSSIPGEVNNLPCHVSALSEVTATFIDSEVTSSVARLQFWISFSRDLSTLPGKTHYMYAYDLEKIKLKKLYKYAKPITLFEGRTLLLEGMAEESDEAIEVAKCSTIMFLPLYAMPAMIKRLFVRKPSQKLHYYMEPSEVGNDA